MSGTRVFLGGLMAALLGLGEARAQTGATGYGPAAIPPEGAAALPANPDGAVAPPTAPQGGGALSDWITYCHGGGCCGPVGGNGHIDSEVYVRSGVAVQVNTGGLSEVLHTTGWQIEGGGRVLFFNTPEDAAWTVDLGVTNINQNATDPGHTFPYQIAVPNPNAGTPGQQPQLPKIVQVTPSALNQTFANLAIGREWWLMGNRNSYDCTMWRAGAEVGGRYGTGRIEFNEIQHRTEMIGGWFVSVHSDLEVPCGHCVWQFGVRVEWGETYTALLQPQNNADLMDFNFLATLGIRF